MKIGLKRLFIIFILPALFSCCQKSVETDPLKKVNYDKLDESLTQAELIGGIKSIVISVDGKTIRERYYNNTMPDTRYDIRSVTKSIIGLLIGISIDKGYIKSIDESIAIYLNPVIDDTLPKDKTEITIRHLLTMSSGLPWLELNVPATEYSTWVNSPNQVKYMLDKTLESKPGKNFNYNTGAIHLSSVILTQATRKKTIDFALENLFKPLAINQIGWLIDKQGYNNGGAGLSITPNDMIKIGNLILSNGIFNNTRLVSADWIDNIKKSQIPTYNAIPYASGYSFGWWTGNFQNNNFVMAMGYGGQFIIVFPELKIVISSTCNWQGLSLESAGQQWISMIDHIFNKVLQSCI